jgi:hypothetical protein
MKLRFEYLEYLGKGLIRYEAIVFYIFKSILLTEESLEEMSDANLPNNEHETAGRLETTSDDDQIEN